MSLRVYLCGQKQFGLDALVAIHAAGHQIVGVSSPPFSTRTGSTGQPLPDRLRAAAQRAGIAWRPAGTLRADDVRAARVDVIVAAHSHDFLGQATRNASRFGAIGYHPSLLPLHRGRDAVRWTLHMGDRVTGGSVYWLDRNVDAGPIAAQELVFIRPTDTVESLWRERLAPLGVKLLVRVLDDLIHGRLIAIPQDEACATWEPSWSRPPLYRPELPQLGGAPEGFTVVRTRD